MASKQKSRTKTTKTKRTTKKKTTKKKVARKTNATAKSAKQSTARKTIRKKAKPAPRKKPSSKRARKETRSPEPSTLGGKVFGTEVRPRRASRTAGQSGDVQGLRGGALADSESVEELLEEGQAREAAIISGVEDALDPDKGEVHTREVPEDDVPEEYDDND